uniref:translation initiation factor IF-2-like n=1 Tax=Nyctereutes procyonoides TaxID=34880 RepID=UPI0024447364|nr:translation initiation factor IF-2-like [Nyctereutes procyonoides]
MGLRGPGPPSAAAAAAATELRAARGRRPASDERRRGAGHARRAASRRAPRTDGRAGQWARAQRRGPSGLENPGRSAAGAGLRGAGRAGRGRGRGGAAARVARGGGEGGAPGTRSCPSARGWHRGPPPPAERRLAPAGPRPRLSTRGRSVEAASGSLGFAGELRGRLAGRWRSSPAVGVRVAGKARPSGNKAQHPQAQAGGLPAAGPAGLPRRAVRSRAQARDGEVLEPRTDACPRRPCTWSHAPRRKAGSCRVMRSSNGRGHTVLRTPPPRCGDTQGARSEAARSREPTGSSEPSACVRGGGPDGSARGAGGTEDAREVCAEHPG